METAPFIHVKRRFLVQDKIKLNSTKVNVTILVERFWGFCAVSVMQEPAIKLLHNTHCTGTTLGSNLDSTGVNKVWD